MQPGQRVARRRRCRDSSRRVIRNIRVEVDVTFPFLVALYAQNRYDGVFVVRQYGGQAVQCKNKLGQVDDLIKTGK